MKVGHNHHVASGREQLRVPPIVEQIGPGVLRSAVHQQQQRVFLARVEPRRGYSPSLNVFAVPTAECETGSLAKLDVLQRLSVYTSQRRGRTGGGREVQPKQFRWMGEIRVREDEERTVARNVHRCGRARRVEWRHFQGVNVQPRQRFMAAVFEGHIQTLAVWRPHVRINGPIGRFENILVFSARPIIEEKTGEVGLLHRPQRGAVSDVAAVRRIEWRAVGGFVGGNGLQRAPTYRHHKQVTVAGQRLILHIAGETDFAAVGRKRNFLRPILRPDR